MCQLDGLLVVVLGQHNKFRQFLRRCCLEDLDVVGLEVAKRELAREVEEALVKEHPVHVLVLPHTHNIIQLLTFQLYCAQHIRPDASPQQLQVGALVEDGSDGRRLRVPTFDQNVQREFARTIQLAGVSVPDHEELHNVRRGAVARAVQEVGPGLHAGLDRNACKEPLHDRHHETVLGLVLLVLRLLRLADELLRGQRRLQAVPKKQVKGVCVLRAGEDGGVRLLLQEEVHELLLPQQARQV
mmetsp:Transcript_12049/g.33956  ORF Transcript_12049/g.33956 Transcript_12049/m.33956 type:complete len:242 (+) Transcript_12049:2727-3452(+)